MATRYWLGVSTDWEDTNNWTANDTPDDGDDVIFPATSRQSCLANLDRTGDTGAAGLDLGSIYVQPGYMGQIGTASNPLKCTVNGEIKHRGANSFYWSNSTGSGGHTTGTVMVDATTAPGKVAMHCGGSQSITRCFFASGDIGMSCTGILTNMDLTRSRNGGAGPRVRFEDGAYVPLEIFINGGSVINDGGGATATIYVVQGKYTCLTAAATQNVYIAAGGVCDWRSDATITTAIVAGKLDMRKLKVATTITNLYVMGSGQLLYDDNLVTITNDFRAVSP